MRQNFDRTESDLEVAEGLQPPVINFRVHAPTHLKAVYKNKTQQTQRLKPF
jgi:hypothetical protein